MSNISDKDHVPEASKLTRVLSSSHWRQLQIRVKKVDYQFRLLVSKFVFSEDPFTEEDRIIFWTCYEKMVQKCAIDSNFRAKHQYWVYSVRHLAQSLNQELNSETRFHYRTWIISITSHGRGYFSGSLYFGRKKEEFLYQIQLKMRQSIKTREKSRIAVGYRDKGHLKESHDGNHDWKEVAMALYDPISESTSEKVEHLWSNLKINSVQELKFTSTPWVG
jgi:hypothetical protein